MIKKLENDRKLLIIRTLKDMTQNQFAELCDISRSKYIPIERGEAKFKSLDLDKLLHQLGMTRDNFDNMSEDLVLGKVDERVENVTPVSKVSLDDASADKKLLATLRKNNDLFLVIMEQRDKEITELKSSLATVEMELEECRKKLPKEQSS